MALVLELLAVQYLWIFSVCYWLVFGLHITFWQKVSHLKHLKWIQSNFILSLLLTHWCVIIYMGETMGNRLLMGRDTCHRDPSGALNSLIHSKTSTRQNAASEAKGDLSSISFVHFFFFTEFTCPHRRTALECRLHPLHKQWICMGKVGDLYWIRIQGLSL